jgi:hypothetical protein
MANAPRSRQTMEGVTATETVGQSSDVPDTDQSMRRVGGSSVTQRVGSQQQSLSIRWLGTANGRWAVIGLVAIALAVVIAKVVFGVF